MIKCSFRRKCSFREMNVPFAKGQFSLKCLKIFFSETIWRMKPKLGILASHITIYKMYVFLFGSDKNSGCYGNLFP